MDKVEDLFTSWMDDAAGYVHANILDDFLTFGNLSVLDGSNCRPHLAAIARIFEER